MQVSPSKTVLDKSGPTFDKADLSRVLCGLLVFDLGKFEVPFECTKYLLDN